MINWNYSEKACHSCKYNRYDREIDRFYCGNEESQRYEDTTEYNETCEEWAEK